METLNLIQSDKNIYKNGHIVGVTDMTASSDGSYFQIPDIVIKGELNGELEYLGKTIVIEQVETSIGLEIGRYGARGPIWKNVLARIVK